MPGRALNHGDRGRFNALRLQAPEQPFRIPANPAQVNDAGAGPGQGR